MPESIQPIITAYENGHQCQLLSGRGLQDLDLSPDNSIATLKDLLRDELWTKHQMATLSFNQALGPEWHWPEISAQERSAYERSFRDQAPQLVAGIEIAQDHRRPSGERAYMMITALYKSLESRELLPPFTLCWDFAEDFVPSQDHGGHSEWITMSSQILQMIADSGNVQCHPFLLVLNGSPEHIDQRVAHKFHHLHLCQPDREQKKQFITALSKDPQLQRTRLSQDLDQDSLANLTAKTPNSSLAKTFRSSALTGSEILLEDVVSQKKNDVVSLSDGTLSLLDTERTRNLKLVGRNVAKPLALLQMWADGLKTGNRYTPVNVILAGAPSSAKTDLALMTAALSGTPTYQILSPKASLVGQTEERVRKLFRVFKEQSPAFGMIDEITEAFPTERNGSNLDSGASASVTAEMLTALSDSSRAGRSLLIATTNCPWKVGAAMASRFLYLPVLSAIREDYPEILCAVAGSLFHDCIWDPSSNEVRNAANIFYERGASPRVMRTLISSKMSTLSNTPDSKLLLRAAQTCAEQDPRDRISGIYADLFAIRACSDLEMLPWYEQPSSYPFPDHLKDIVDKNSGEIDTERLERDIKSLEPHVNV